jgi:hypothetical protein
MDLEFSREKIAEQLHKNWLVKVQEEMEQLLNEESEKVSRLINRTSELDDKEGKEKAFLYLSEQLKSKGESADQPDRGEQEHTEWMQKFKPITCNIPNMVILPQDETRFLRKSSDSVFIGTGKLFKRMTLDLHRGGQSLKNGFRKLTGKEPEPQVQWTQQVPLRNVVYTHFLNAETWIAEWEYSFRKLESSLLLAADSKMLKDSQLIDEVDVETSDEPKEDLFSFENDVKDEKSFQRTLDEAKKEVAQITEKYQGNLGTFIKDIENEIFKAVTITGTIERPTDYYSDKEADKAEGQCNHSIQKRNKEWKVLQNVLCNRLLLTVNFLRLHEQVKERVGGFSTSWNEFFESSLTQQLQDVEVELDETIKVFEASEGHTSKEIKELNSIHREKISELIEKQLVAPLKEFRGEATLSNKLDRFISAIPEWTNFLPEKAVLVEHIDLEENPPRYEFEEVNWKTLVQRVLNNQLTKEFAPKDIKPEEFISMVTLELEEISQIAITNLELADEVKKSDDEDPFQVAKEGLLRAKNMLLELSEKVEQKKNNLTENLAEKQKVSFKKLALLLEKQDVNEVRFADAQYMAKETAVDWKIKAQVWWANTSEKLELFARFIWKKLRQYFEVIRKLLGFAEKKEIETAKTDLATFLSKTDESIAKLPFIYRRLFDFNKEVDDRFFIRQPSQFKRCKKGYELWLDDFPTTIAAVGEKGSGKTLFVKMLEAEVLKKHDTTHINFNGTIWKPEQVIEKISKVLKIDGADDIESLIDAIHRKKKREVLILENVQNCYVRNIHGFEAMEQLLFLISETNKEILWVVSCTRYGWLFLDKVMDIADYFTHVVESDTLSEQQIEELILKRHRASGYHLEFLADQAILKSRSYKKLMDDEEKKQEFLQQRYFEKLSKLSEGNATTAMIFWIRSIKEFNDTHFVINPFEFGSTDRISKLESPDLFALAAFVLHDFLNAPELAMIMHQSERDSRLTISRLSSKSILIASEHGYTMNNLIYRQVVRVLKEANYIH